MMAVRGQNMSRREGLTVIFALLTNYIVYERYINATECLNIILFMDVFIDCVKYSRRRNTFSQILLILVHFLLFKLLQFQKWGERPCWPFPITLAYNELNRNIIYTSMNISTVKNAVFCDVAPCNLVWTDVSGECIASIFRVEKSASDEPAWVGGCCSHWFLVRRFLYPEDGSDTFLGNVHSYKIYMVPHPEDSISS
jgi:hypothetical protein